MDRLLVPHVPPDAAAEGYPFHERFTRFQRSLKDWIIASGSKARPALPSSICQRPGRVAHGGRLEMVSHGVCGYVKGARARITTLMSLELLFSSPIQQRSNENSTP
jgi:hypothetical protein